ncbi:MAG: hypothetical protein Q8P92_05190 [Candidatus Daviesbacteria bacterium]|nr:hypothetical protein [Candidatus Daviesbacteria bacterium]
MTNGLETARNYLGSVVERTVGWAGYQREHHLESISHPITNQSSPVEIKHNQSQAVLTGLTVGFLTQISAPITYEGFKRFANMDTLPLVLMGTGAVDTLSTIPAVIFLSYGHPAEAILVKLAANAAIHVGLDLIRAAARRIKTFRPPADILAV